MTARWRTHWGWCRHLRKFGILDAAHAACVHSDSCLATAQDKADTK